MTTFEILAVILAAFSSCGSVGRRSLSVARFVVLISRVAIRISNRSSVSSIALASRCRITAVSMAVCFGSEARSSFGAVVPSPYRANAASRFGGTLFSFTRPSRYAAISSTRCNTFFIAVPVVRVGGLRSCSRYECRLPTGVFSSATRSPANDGSARHAAFATVVCSRFSAMRRTSATSRASTETPASSTRLRRSQPTAWSNSAFGPSTCAVHARPCRNARNFRPISWSS
ncbi:hypothetical protein RM609_33810 [Streptomyces sp. DSM 40473]|uniref:Secreted protein n=1 Tax=Streptomyces hesseae TaxID=3075519 RepID=A0ABU2SYD9_9ACTN|nr:hypothetical protein [Streptomyces sp. DSM 40473]MDT0454017.1 hypothetical protein [Streptomyces sp. DSM 40473]